MKRPVLLAAIVAAVVVVVVAVVMLVSGGDDDPTPHEGDASSETTGAGPAVASDDAWCAGWDQVVSTQAVWVSDPTDAHATAVLDAVTSLRSLGVPESLDPNGYTELGAVLDDVHGAVDPSFTPTVLPSEPADVESDNAAEAPFGAWLAEHCPR